MILSSLFITAGRRVNTHLDRAMHGRIIIPSPLTPFVELKKRLSAHCEQVRAQQIALQAFLQATGIEQLERMSVPETLAQFHAQQGSGFDIA
jgi:hypothetical protein